MSDRGGVAERPGDPFVLRPGVGHAKVSDAEIGRMASAQIVVNALPTRLHQAAARIAVEDRREGEGVAVARAKTDDASAYHHMLLSPSRQLFKLLAILYLSGAVPCSQLMSE